jgi:uncharacterized membrane protein
MVGHPRVNFRRAAGLAFGCGLLLLALLAGVNALRIVVQILLGSSPDAVSVFFVMVNLGTALLVGTGGYVVLQRVRRTGAGYGVDLGWGRVLGP